MADQRKSTRKTRTIALERLLDAIVIEKFGKPEDNGQASPAFERALEEATRGYKPSVELYQRVADEAKKSASKKTIKESKNVR